MTAIDGVIAAGQTWKEYWQVDGNNADGFIATKDGSLLIAQNDNSTVVRMDMKGKITPVYTGLNTSGSLSINAKGALFVANRGFNPSIEQLAHLRSGLVLVTGPTGAGKSKLARRIFEMKKARQKIAGQFVELNCAVLRGDQAMSALFGHVKGSFTGATNDRPGVLKAAHLGMLFLDEIGEMPLPLQTRLLRVLEEKEIVRVGGTRPIPVDVRIISATHCDLQQRVANHLFRADLFYRLGVLREIGRAHV